MVVAKCFDGDLDRWNQQLDSCINPNIFSVYEWGEYKRQSWAVERLCFFSNEKYIGQVQILFKKIGPFKFGWCSSGINLVNYDHLDGIVKSIESFYNLKKTYIRFNFFDLATGENRFLFDSISAFTTVRSSVNSGYTVRFYDLPHFPNEPGTYSKNNKYYLKKAISNGLVFSLEPFDLDEFCRVHAAMAQIKDIGHLTVSREDMGILHKFFGDKLRLANVKKDGVTIAVVLLIIHHNLMYYYLAGSTSEGRKLSASFMMVDEILKVGKGLSIKEFDFGGISPFDASVAGINRFKMGFGGTVANYVGEKNLCHSSILRKVFDFIVERKLR